MTKLIRVSALALLALLAPLVSAGFADDDSPLGERMEAMSHNLKAVQKQITDPSKKDSTLALIDQLRRNAVAARDYIPSMSKSVPEKNRADFILDFKGAMDELIDRIDALDKAVHHGKLDEAKSIIKGILDAEREGHGTFRAKKDGGEGELHGRHEHGDDD